MYSTSQDYEDVIRTHAMDRSIRNMGSSRSPVKMRPNFREDLSVQCVTPKKTYYQNNNNNACFDTKS